MRETMNIRMSPVVSVPGEATAVTPSMQARVEVVRENKSTVSASLAGQFESRRVPEQKTSPIKAVNSEPRTTVARGTNIVRASVFGEYRPDDKFTTAGERKVSFIKAGYEHLDMRDPATKVILGQRVNTLGTRVESIVSRSRDLAITGGDAQEVNQAAIETAYELSLILKKLTEGEQEEAKNGGIIQMLLEMIVMIFDGVEATTSVKDDKNALKAA